MIGDGGEEDDSETESEAEFKADIDWDRETREEGLRSATPTALPADTEYWEEGFEMTAEDREDAPASHDRTSDEVEGKFGYRPPPDRPSERPDVIEGYEPPPKPAEPMAEPDPSQEPAEPEGTDE